MPAGYSFCAARRLSLCGVSNYMGIAAYLDVYEGAQRRVAVLLSRAWRIGLEWAISIRIPGSR